LKTGPAVGQHHRDLAVEQGVARLEFFDGGDDVGEAVRPVLAVAAGQRDASVADAGADLRHPEVIEFDALWRAEQMREAPHASEAREPALEEFLTLMQAEDFIRELEKRRLYAAPAEVQGIRSIAIKARETAQSHARRKTLGLLQKAEQQEIAEWLGVWIKTPGLFKDWLELRKRSVEFRKKFLTESL